MSYARKSVSQQDIDPSCAHADNRVSAEPFQVPVPNRVQHALPVSSAPAGYYAVKIADEEEWQSPAEKDARPSQTNDITGSRAASPLLGSSTSRIAVYDDPFSDAAPSAPPVSPIPPLPSHVLEGRAVLEKYSRVGRTIRRAQRREARREVQVPSRQEARQSRTRYAADGGVRLAGGRDSSGTTGTVPDGHSMHSSSTMPPPYADYD